MCTHFQFTNAQNCIYMQTLALQLRNAIVPLQHVVKGNRAAMRANTHDARHLTPTANNNILAEQELDVTFLWEAD